MVEVGSTEGRSETFTLQGDAAHRRRRYPQQYPGLAGVIALIH